MSCLSFITERISSSFFNMSSRSIACRGLTWKKGSFTMDTISIGLGELYRPNYKENAWLTLHMAKEIIASQACKKKHCDFSRAQNFKEKLKLQIIHLLMRKCTYHTPKLQSNINHLAYGILVNRIGFFKQRETILNSAEVKKLLC